MAANFPRLKVWVPTEDVTSVDLNAEFDNILNNLGPGGMGGFSASIPQMQSQVDPGELGSENPATTLAGELERLRFILHEITGNTYWYQSPSTSLSDLAAAVGTGLTPNRNVSGRTSSTSEQPMYLVPNGTVRTVKVDGAPTPFVYYIEGIRYEITTDTLLTNLVAAPSSNNTALVNDTLLSGQDWTKNLGEDGSEIAIDTIGANISSLVGKMAAFKVGAEYFIAEVGLNKLHKARRGYFFDSSDNPFSRVALSNNDTITLMKLSWIFAKTDLSLTVTYENPIYSADEPASPNVNDYWFDVTEQKWKRFDLSNFVDADATLIGVCFQNATATLGARSYEFFRAYDALDTVELTYESSTEVQTKHFGAEVSVWGSIYKFDQGHILWDITTDLDTELIEGASTYYYLYLTEDGDRVISDVKPYDRRSDLMGFYHPYQSWRALGSFFNDGSSNVSNVESIYNSFFTLPILPPQIEQMGIQLIPRLVPLNSSAGAFTWYLPPAINAKGFLYVFAKISLDGNMITLMPFGNEKIMNESSQTIQAPYTLVTLISLGDQWVVGL